MIKSRVRILGLTAALTLFGAATAYAGGTVSSVQYDGNNKVTIRIQSDEARASLPVSVRITDGEGRNNVFEQGFTDDSGLFEFSYMNNTGSGVHTIYANLNGEVITGQYHKMNKSDYEEFVHVINEQHRSAKPNGAPIKAVFDKYAEFTALDMTVLDVLGDPDGVYQFIADDTTYKGAINSFEDVENAFYAAVVLERFKENKESIFESAQAAPYSEALSQFAPTLSAAAEAIKPSVKTAVLSALRSEYTSSSELAETTELLILQKTISGATHWNDVRTILDIYKSELGININGAGSDVFKSMAGKSYSSYSDVVSDFNKLLSGKPGSSGGSGGSGGGGGGSSSSDRGTAIPPGVMQNPAQSTAEPSQNAGGQNVQSGQLPFTDMDDAKWAIEAVLYVYERGIVSGVSDTEFEPNRFITRAEAVKLLMTMAGIEPENINMPFSDVNESDWYYPYIAAAYRSGIVNGKSDDYFDAQAQVTRQEMAVMTYRTIMIRNTMPDSLPEVNFSDKDEIADWADEAVTYLYSQEIMIGRNGSKFDPTDNITRAESATVIYNVLKSNSL